MPRFRVEISPEALAHAQTINEWWVANRPKSPTLFLRELRRAIRLLRHSPTAGRPYEHRAVRPTRRLVLSGSRYHVYYWPDAAAKTIRIYAIWHTARAEGPPSPA